MRARPTAGTPSRPGRRPGTKARRQRTRTTASPTSAHGGNAFALRVLDDNNGSPLANRYYSFDHLGSVTAMSDDQGRLSKTETSSMDATVLGYDAWGARRNADESAASYASFDVPVG